MAKRFAKVVEGRLAELGYRFDRVNSKSCHVFVQAGHPDVVVNTGISEHAARILLRSVDRHHGIEHVTNKRNATAIKERRRAEADRIRAEMDRLDAERADLIRRRELLPTGEFDLLARNDRLALERELQRIDRERRDFVRLMTKLEGERSEVSA